LSEAGLAVLPPSMTDCMGMMADRAAPQRHCRQKY